MSTNTQKVTFLYELKVLILIFFGCWFLLASITNSMDFLAHIHWLGPHAFSSGNGNLIAQVIAIYHLPHYVATSLFLADILIQFLCAILFFKASSRFINQWRYWPSINIAFVVSIALWMLFILMEEIFIAYSYEAIHIRLLILELIAFLIIHLLPPCAQKG